MNDNLSLVIVHYRDRGKDYYGLRCATPGVLTVLEVPPPEAVLQAGAEEPRVIPGVLELAELVEAGLILDKDQPVLSVLADGWPGSERHYLLCDGPKAAEWFERGLPVPLTRPPEKVWVLTDNGYWNLEGPNFIGLFDSVAACRQQVKRGLVSYFGSSSEGLTEFQVEDEVVAWVTPDCASPETWHYSSPKWEARLTPVEKEVSE